MIHVAIAYVVSQLNDYLNLRSTSLSTERVVSGTLFSLDGTVNEEAKDHVVLSLVNVEQDRVYRSVTAFETRSDGTGAFIRPEVKVNLFLLFVANFNDYEEALKALAYVISFFQHRNTFAYSSIPELSDRSGYLSFELVSLSFEQQNHLWGAMGAKYMPSVMYKVGILDIQDEQVEAEVPPVEQVLVNEVQA